MVKGQPNSSSVDRFERARIGRQLPALLLAGLLVAASCGTTTQRSDAAEQDAGKAAPALVESDDPEVATTDQSASASGTTPTSVEPLPWANGTVETVGRLVTDGTVVLGVEVGDRDIELVALDVLDGSELWRAPWSPGGGFGGIGFVGFEIVDGVVAHASGPLDNPEATVIIARDALTGEQLWEIPAPHTFGVEACGPVFCAGRFDSGQRLLETVGLDPTTGAQAWATFGIDLGFFPDSDLAVSLWVGDEPLITGIDPTFGEIWQFSPEDDLGIDMSSNYGWSFDAIEDVLVVTFSRPSEPSTITAGSFGLDAATGDLLWFAEDTGVTGWANDATPMLTPFVLDEGAAWFEHTEVIVLDPRSGLSESRASLPPSEPFEEFDFELAYETFTSAGLVYGLQTRYDSAGNVFWLEGSDWRGIDPLTAEPVKLDEEVLWYTRERLVDLTPLGGAETLGGPFWHAMDPATGEDLDTSLLDPPFFVGESAAGWIVYADANGVIRGVPVDGD